MCFNVVCVVYHVVLIVIIVVTCCCCVHTSKGDILVCREFVVVCYDVWPIGVKVVMMLFCC